LFLDNLGSIFLALVASLIVFIYRSTVSNGRIDKLRTEIEDTSVLDPMEVNEIRFANTDFTADIYNEIVITLYKQFASNTTELNYEEFVPAVMTFLEGNKLKHGLTMQYGHLLDRVVYNLMETKNKQNESGGGFSTVDRSTVDVSSVDYEKPQSLLFFMVLLSLCINSTPAERLDSLHKLLVVDAEANNGNGNGGRNGDGDEKKAPLETIKKLVTHLQTTCQLPPEIQVIETGVRYPFVEHKRATGGELVGEALEGLGWKEGEDAKVRTDYGVTLGDFVKMLKSRGICYCGECYSGKNSRK